MGDAVHRHPPSNGLGSNTSVQDAYNLAWKLAYVLRGTAGPGLLDSYDTERAPIGRQIVLRANKSIEEFGPIFEAFGFTDTSDPDVMNERMRARADDNPQAARQREQLRAALGLKDYEFNAHGGRARPALPFGCRGGRRNSRTELHPRLRALLSPDHLAGRAAAALLAGGRRAQGQHPRSRGQRPLCSADWDLRTALGRGGSERLETARDRARGICDRTRTRLHRSVRGLVAPARGRRGRMRARATSASQSQSQSSSRPSKESTQ